MIDHLLSTGVGVAYYYLERGAENQSAEDIFECLIKQLAQQVSELPLELLDTLEQLLNQRDSYDRLVEVLALLSHHFRRLFLVFDALDKCKITEKKKLLESFQKLTKKGVRIFVVSRSDYDIDNTFNASNVPVIELLTNPEDVDSYIKAQLENDPIIRNLFRDTEVRHDQELHVQIRSALLGEDGGTYVKFASLTLNRAK